jgi:hypothetical protein
MTGLRLALAALALHLAAPAPAQEQATSGPRHRVLVELFTSQG